MNLLVTSSPHIHSGRTTSRLMADVLLALIPAVLAGCYFFGLRAAILMVVSIASCKIAEFLWCAVRRQPHTLRDCSAAVTGLLLALTLPVSVPYWVPVVGGFFAMIVVKGLGGGLGQNTFNPALAARALLVLLFPAVMTRFAPVGTAISSASMSVDMVSAATPLHHMVMPELPNVSLLDAFLGNLPGSIGEVSALALLIGGAYLVIRKVISLRIPVAYLATVAVLTLIFNKGQDPVLWMAYNLLCGGVLLGAIFMADRKSVV